MLTREQILAAKDLPRELVNVPEWGGEVYVSTMTGSARDAWEASLLGKDRKVDLTNARSKLVAACLVDEGGTLLFTADDIAALGGKSSSALERVSKVAQRLNRITEDDLDDAVGN